MKLLPCFVWLCLPVLLPATLLVGAEKTSDPRQPPGHLSETQKAHWSPLGLPRLRPQVPAGKGAALDASGYEVDALTLASEPPGRAIKAAKQGPLDVLQLDPQAELSRPLRTAPRKVSFHSFLIYGSQSTVISVGGAWLGLTASPIADLLQVAYGEGTGQGLEWKSTRLHVPLDLYGGQSLATLPVLTVRLDPAAGVWDLYSGERLVFASIPLLPGDKPADRNTFVLRAGNAGAWLVGLVQSDDNPLFEDTNRNGIDDTFERKQLGSLQPTGASAAERGTLAAAWQADALKQPPAAWLLDRPRPDRLLAR